MPGYNGAGIYSRNYNFQNDAAAGIKILASRMDTELASIVGAFNTAFCRDGQAPATANFNMAGHMINNLQSGPIITGTGGLSAVNGAAVAAALQMGQFSQYGDTAIPPVYISPTSFSLALDLHAIYVPGTRLKAVVTAGTTFGVVKTATWDGAKTTFVVSNLFGDLPLDAGLSSVLFGIIQGPKGGTDMGSCFLANCSGTQTVIANTPTQMLFDTLFQDQLGETSLPQFLTKTGGRYLVSVSWNPNVTQQYNLIPRVNAVSSNAYQEVRTITAGDFVQSHFQVTAPAGIPIDVWIQAPAGFILGSVAHNQLNITQLM